MLLYLQMIETSEDKTKFEALYLEYRDLMFYVANGILHHQQDAEDAIQESFLKMINILEKITDLKCPKTKSLVVIITERTAIDLYRRKKKRGVASMDDEKIALFLSVEPENTEEKTSIAVAMASLPAKYRAVLLLRYDNGFSEEEVAQILSMSSANVHKTIQRAKKKLKRILEEQEGNRYGQI